MIAENSPTSPTQSPADAEADVQLALSYVHGLGRQINISQGVQLMRKAAVNGSKEAQFMLGKWYKQGGPLAPDEAEAIFWLRKSANQGHEPAVNMLLQLGVVWRAPADMQSPVQAPMSTTAARPGHMELVPAAPPVTPNPPMAEAPKVRITKALMDEWTAQRTDRSQARPANGWHLKTSTAAPCQGD